MEILAALYVLVAMVTAADPPKYAAITETWSGGFKGVLTIIPPENLHGWTLHIIFSKPITQLEIWKADIEYQSSTHFIVHNVESDEDLPAGVPFDIEFVARSPGWEAAFVSYYIGSYSTMPPTTTTTAPTTTTTLPTTSTDIPTTTLATTTQILPAIPPNPLVEAYQGSGGTEMKYDYGEAMSLSIEFYNAQRSGKLPDNYSIAWRDDSALDDADGDHDLSGGWYDGDDHVKFGLPMAWTSWVLNFGFLKFHLSYEITNQTEEMCDMLRWPLEYFLKCWLPDDQTLYVQVGDPILDHAYWGPPETMNMSRPAYKVTKTCPGSDVAAKTVSALTSGYLVFRDLCADEDFADDLLEAAISLYKFAIENRGIYTDCVKEAQDFYGSTGDSDELSTAASWLYHATDNIGYLADAEQFYIPGTAWAFDWNDDNVGAALLLYESTQGNVYKRDIKEFISNYNGSEVLMTPCGLSFVDYWGSNRYAVNAAFIALVAASDGIIPDVMKSYAMSQINYILGDNNLDVSYMVGFGTGFPGKPYHRASACRMEAAECYIDDIGDNPNQLNGALVAGPDQHDNYIDERTDYIHNDVSIDYNAGIHGALAGLRYFAARGILPEAPTPPC